MRCACWCCCCQAVRADNRLAHMHKADDHITKTSTPVGALLAVVNATLMGHEPNMQDALLARTALLRGW